MDTIEELQTIFEQDYSDFYDNEWSKQDDWLFLNGTFQKSTYDLIPDEDFRQKSLDADQISEPITVITDYSDESEASLGLKLIEPIKIGSDSDDISLSDSVLSLSNLSISYPIPDDLGLEAAFWILYPDPPNYKCDGVDKFFDYVKILNLAPISSLRQQLKSDRVILKFYGIHPDVVQVLGEALLFNTTVKILDLEENSLTPSSCYHLNKLLLRSTVLNSLNLTACKIGLEGAMKLEDGIALSSALRELNLSRCNLRNEGFYYVAKSVAANTLIKKLDISDNNLDEESAAYLQKILISTESLEYLNISWNDFYTKAAIEQVFGGLSKNSSLVELNMSWNAMGKNGIYNIKNYITYTKNLKYLNLSGNRFTDFEAQKIAYAVLKNRSLLEFRFDKNPLSSEAVAGFIRTLSRDEFIYQSPLRLLDLGSFWSAKNGLPAIEQLREFKPNLAINLSGILENFNILGPDLKALFFKTANYEAMSCKIKKDRKNFGHFVLSLEDSRISKDKFKELVEYAKIPITESLVKEIMNQFLVTKKFLDQAALKESYLSYFPDTELPKPKSVVVVANKKDKKNKEG
ncbi:leucine-rich repeat-containing protein 74A-like [Phymastichus coffea]|uniref:leucine-rich repeat-containing protein 74A-like n=1 Tax=Phymastichus coffea TaxID=108790 RepID=UPI00273BEDD2|nr:leucine-rich repeat-containing protein 74A-like [Phymastichus coffea]